jgi:hypothetical protein
MALSQLRKCGRLARLALQQSCQQAAGGLPTAAAGSSLRLPCVAATRAPPPWHPSSHSRGFAADAAVGAGGAVPRQRHVQQPGVSPMQEAWAQDGAFVVRLTNKP